MGGNIAKRDMVQLFGEQDTLEQRLAALDQLFDSGAMKTDGRVQATQRKRGPKFTPKKKKRK